MKRLLSTRYLEARWEPRWPALAIGFYGGKYNERTFIVLIAPLVIEIGRRA